MSLILSSILLLTILQSPVVAVSESEFLNAELHRKETAIVPQAAKNNVIVVVPGILGSELKYGSTKAWLPLPNISSLSHLACSETGSSLKTITAVTPQGSTDKYGVQDIYKNIYQELNNSFSSVADVKFFAYDWRLSCQTTAANLKNLVSSYTGQIIIVAHSMGGLVGSDLIRQESVSQRNRTTLITIGTPFTGATKAITMMENGETGFCPVEIVDQVAGLFLNNYAQNFPAVYELLPTSRSQAFITVPGTGNLSYSDSINLLKSQSWGKRTNGTVKPMFSQAQSFIAGIDNSSGLHYAYMGKAAYHIVATGQNTTNIAVYRRNSDGSYVYSAYGYNNSGDGTVPLLSATNGLSVGNSRVTQYSTVGDHVNMVKHSTVCAKVKSLISSTLNSASSISSDIENLEGINSELVINDRGWIIAPDINGHRININVNFLPEHRLLTENGQEILRTGEYLFYYDAQGEPVSVGSRWKTGIGVQYALFDGAYRLEIDDVNSNGEVTISYMNNGYYDKYLEYIGFDTTSSCEIILSPYSELSVEAISVGNNMRSVQILEPSHLYSEEDLAVLNQD